MKNTTEIWGKTLKYFQENNPDDYSLWLMNLNFVHLDKKKQILKLSVTNPVVKDKIINHFKQDIEKVFSDFSQIPVELQLIISDEEKSIFEEGTVNELNRKKQREIEEANKKARKVDKLISGKSVTVNLNQKFTFDRFVMGSNNELAHNAAMYIANHPGKDYNPFFIYGGVGLGKTHLMQAIGNFLLQHRPDVNVVYVTVENYLNDWITAIQSKRLDSFRAKYRDADVVLLDDIQFLEDKGKTQEELFHTFNKLHNNNKQIVFTCDKPPKELKKIEERLITRFSWGLVVDIKQPEMETRKKIIIKKLQELQLIDEVSEEIIDYLSENITTNIRDIESAINKIKSLIFLTSKTLSISLLEDQLSDLLTPLRAKNKTLSCYDIQNQIALFYNIAFSDLSSSKRTKDVSFPRQMAMYLTKELTTLSLSEIGSFFGGRDHSTVLASCKKVNKEIKSNSSRRNDYEELLKKLSSF